MRYFLELAYNGSRFHGWQRQPNAISVQQRIEECMSVILQQKIEIVGAGRTDTGVNARRMFAHFDIDKTPPFHDSFVKGLNRMLGADICIRRVISVNPDAHARFDATEREYKYFVIFEKSPFLRDFTWQSPSRLDAEKMNEAARILLRTHDFTSFSKLHTDVKTNICDVRMAQWTPYENQYGVPGIVFTIKADRFLRNMVRAVVGTLVEVGRDKISVSDFKEIIEAKDRCRAGTSMPAEALFLWDVKYPYIFDT